MNRVTGADAALVLLVLLATVLVLARTAERITSRRTPPDAGEADPAPARAPASARPAPAADYDGDFAHDDIEPAWTEA